MRVLLLTGNFPPEAFGGTETVVAALGTALCELGDRVVVVCSSDLPHPGRDVVEESWSGLSVRRLFRRPEEHQPTELHRPRVLGLLREILAAERCEVVHVHHLAAVGAGILQAARQKGLATVLTFHDLWTTCPRYFRVPPAGIACPTEAGRDSCVLCVDHALHRGAKWVRAALADRDLRVRAEVEAAQRLTAPSRTAAEQIRRHLPWEGEVAVIPHGLVRVPGPGERPAPPAPDRDLRVGMFGNLVADKGVEELVAAVAGLPVELHLFGRFLEPEFEARTIALAAARGVVLAYHGPFDPRSRHPAAQLDLAVFPSRCQETYGLVVDEALAYGVPAVVSDRGALAERRNQGGVLVVPLPELQAAMRALVLDRQRYDALRAAVPDRLPTAVDMARRYRHLYREALETE